MIDEVRNDLVKRHKLWSLFAIEKQMNTRNNLCCSGNDSLLVRAGCWTSLTDTTLYFRSIKSRRTKMSAGRIAFEKRIKAKDGLISFERHYSSSI